MVMNSAQRAGIAESLRRASQSRRPVAPLTSAYSDLTLDDAYAVQTINIQHEVAGGARVVGHKLGLTSPVMQKMMGVGEPDFGHLLDTMVLNSARPVSLAGFIQPRVELELAFVLSEALPADCNETDVLAATEYVVPCLELIDSRIEDWKIRLLDTVADNASSAGVILGDARFSPCERPLDDSPARMRIDGIEVATGSTGDVLGNPARAVAWLARTLAGFGVALEPGHLVLSGSCTRAVDVRAGNRVEAEFDGFGRVSVEFC